MAKLGLVFSGGGGKGAYQIGVWKALKEFGLAEKVEVLSGCSVGVLNALLFARGDYEVAEHVWRHIRQEDVLNIDPERVLNTLQESPVSIPPAILDKIVDLLNNHGLWSRKGLSRMIREHVDYTALLSSGPTIYAACTDVSDIPDFLRPFTIASRYLLGEANPPGRIRYFRLNQYSPQQIETLVLASSALPIIFRAEEFQGRFYYDGGIMDNIPIQPAYDEGCDLILVVQLDGMALVKPEEFPNTEILTIVPQDSLGNFLEGTLDFSPEGAQNRIAQGYADAARILAPAAAVRDIQQQIAEGLDTTYAAEREFQERHNELLQQRRSRKHTLENMLAEKTYTGFEKGTDSAE